MKTHNKNQNQNLQWKLEHKYVKISTYLTDIGVLGI